MFWMQLVPHKNPSSICFSFEKGKKIVSYEEGGTNGLFGAEMMSSVGLICVTDANGTGSLEAWIVPICGDSGAVMASE